MINTKIGYRVMGALASAALALSSTASMAAPAQKPAAKATRVVAKAPAPAAEQVFGESLRGRPTGLPPGIVIALTVAAGAGLIVAIAAITKDKKNNPVSP